MRALIAGDNRSKILKTTCFDIDLIAVVSDFY
jgi:hypothetical protein